MRRILNDLEIEAPGQSLHTGHVPDLTTVMNWQNCHDLPTASESLFDSPFRIGDVHVEIRFPAIHEQRCRIEITYDLGGRRESHGGNDGHVARRSEERRVGKEG